MFTAKYECRNADRHGGSVWIDQWKYDVIRRGIMKALASEPSLSFKKLVSIIRHDLPVAVKGNLGSIGWYTKIVAAELVRREEIIKIRRNEADHFKALQSLQQSESTAAVMPLKSLA